MTSLTTIVDQQLDDAQSQEFDRQPDQLCRSIWTYLNARETFEDAESFHFARQFREHGKLYDAFEVELENHVALDATAIDEVVLAAKIKGVLELKPEISCTVKALDLPATETHPASIMLIVRHGGPLPSYGAAMRDLGVDTIRHEKDGRWINNRAENSHLPFRRRERAMLRFWRMRNSPLFTAQSTIISTRNGTSTADQISKKIEPLLSTSGANFWRHKICWLWQTETG